MIESFNGFDDLYKNCKYIDENSKDIVGQGLCYCYDVLIFGTGENKYTFLLEFEDKEYLFETKDDFILEWRIRSFPEDENGKEENNFEFLAYGNLKNNGYFYISSQDCDDNTILNIDNKIFKVKKIIVEIKDESLKPIFGISNCYQYCDKILLPRQDKINNFQNQPLLFNIAESIHLKTFNDKEFIFINDTQIYLKILEPIKITCDDEGLFECEGYFHMIDNEIDDKCFAQFTYYYYDDEWSCELTYDNLFGTHNKYFDGKLYSIDKLN